MPQNFIPAVARKFGGSRESKFRGLLQETAAIERKASQGSGFIPIADSTWYTRRQAGWMCGKQQAGSCIADMNSLIACTVFAPSDGSSFHKR